MFKSILPLVAIAALAVTSPVLASDSQDTARQLIRYNAADLDKPKSRDLLMLRIERAARNVCGTPVTGSLEESDAIRECRTRAADMAIAQVPVKMASND
jgi:UrcA family protein